MLCGIQDTLMGLADLTWNPRDTRLSLAEDESYLDTCGQSKYHSLPKFRQLSPFTGPHEDT